MHFDLCSNSTFSYAILAPDQAQIGEEKKRSAEMMARLAKEDVVKTDEYRIGHTKVFFKAGVLARMEEHRDEAIAKMMLKFQASTHALSTDHNAHFTVSVPMAHRRQRLQASTRPTALLHCSAEQCAVS